MVLRYPHGGHRSTAGRPTASRRSVNRPPRCARPTNQRGALGRTTDGRDEGVARSRTAWSLVGRSPSQRRPSDMPTSGRGIQRPTSPCIGSRCARQALSTQFQHRKPRHSTQAETFAGASPTETGGRKHVPRLRTRGGLRGRSGRGTGRRVNTRGTEPTGARETGRRVRGRDRRRRARRGSGG
jgi:hypothetical protein